ncbi:MULTISPECIES: gliding motility-associated C-terminal domain-containing protein [Leeuwenhoekiella]|uniref:Putative hemagglutinin/hemolysin-related protein n=1 Tax=Leeuwenhoekiella blandensis (strain CECT 7118 / CCUG 51940 / KCTC 22103 / MED217) TaxID=398720 RepID=A3XMG3_LEEBM|nr:gliding motility-associated C-terminal domain-containing protein [Leeuwenhoekiella blandensis]EAQ49261.1 putative hemagglutinin/hemolysin-related protein [Leeuwenhoekiella blandensis MED217]
MHKTITFLGKMLCAFFLLFNAGISSKSYGQCAGEDASITSCDKESNQYIDLFAALGGSPVAGGVWFDSDNSGGLNTATGELNTWLINRGGTFSYTYTVEGETGCSDNQSTVTLTLAGYAGSDNFNAVACEDETNINLFQFVGSNPNPTLFGTWAITSGPSDALNGPRFNAQQAGPGSYTFTYTVDAQGSCPSTMSTVVMQVVEAPESGTVDPAVNTSFCETDDLSGQTNFDLRDVLIGEDTNGVWTETTTNEISGFNDSVINIQNIRDNFGPGIYNFTYTVQPTNPLCDLSQTTVSIEIEEVVDFTNANLELTFPAEEDDVICEDTLPINTTATITGDSADIPDGDYELTYEVSPSPNTGMETITITMSNGVGSFAVNPDFFTAAGVAEVRVISIIDPNTENNCEALIANLSDTLTIVALPDLTDTQISVDQPLCLDENGRLTLSDAGTTAAIELIDGEYAFTYTLESSTTSQEYTQTATVLNGEATITLATNALPNADDYTVTLSSVQNSTSCTTPVDLSTTFTVLPKPDAETVSVSINDTCEDDVVSVNITDTAETPNLVDGTYDFTYDISGAITVTDQIASSVTITDGSGSFDLPQDILANGSSTLTLTSVSNSTSTCEADNLTMPAASFNIVPTPDATNAVLAVADTCEDGGASVTFTADASLILDGDYTLTYTLSGANTTEATTTTVTFTSGSASFDLTAEQLAEAGTTTVTVTSLATAAQSCEATGLPLATDFEVLPLPALENTTLAVASVCFGENTSLEFSGSDLPDGSYEITYELSEANTFTETVSTTFTGGEASIVLDAANLTATGSTTVTVTSITNESTACVSTVATSTTFDVNPIPDAETITVSINDTCEDDVVSVNITDTAETPNLADGTYDFTYDISGAITVTDQIASSVIITDGSGSFDLPQDILANGSSTLTLTSVSNSTSTCEADNLTMPAASFNIVPTPDATNAVLAVADTCEDGGASVTFTADASLILDGDYTLTYTLSGANTTEATTTTVTFTSGSSSFDLTAEQLAEAGTTTVTVTSLATAAQSCEATGLPLATDFEVLPLPTLENTTLAVASVCFGEDTTLEFSESDLPDGSYEITYELSDANTFTETVSTIFTGGEASIVLDAANLTATGSTTVTVTSITNESTACVSTVATNTTFDVNPIPELATGDLIASDICLAESGFVTVDAGSSLADGEYTIEYTLSGANTTTGLTETVAIANGSGTFSIPSTALSATGTTTITATLISSTFGCSSVPASVEDTFEVLPLPDAQGAVVSASDVCFGEEVNVTLSGATALNDGDYIVSYQITGATTSEILSETITVTGGAATITLDPATFTAGGATTFSLLDLQNSLTSCSAINLGTAFTQFTVEDPAVPTISSTGAIFCINDDPTVADLEANVSSSFAIITYDAASGGSVISPSTLLQANTTYYIAAQNTTTGCEGSQRLAVTIDLTGCDSVFIPDGFSPNGDGINDVFEMKNMDIVYPNYTIEIFNRNGAVVFKGDAATGFWNGQSNQSRLGGNTLPNGVYFYIINYNNGQTSPKQGKVYLNR